MKYQRLFSEKNKKNVAKCQPQKFFPTMLSVKDFIYNVQSTLIISNKKGPEFLFVIRVV